MPLKNLIILVSILNILSPQTAHALTLCTVLCSCSITTPITLVFANGYDPSSANDTTGSTNIQVNCSLLSGITAFLVSYTVGLTKGNGNSYSPRLMTGASPSGLQYNLYSDSLFGSIWEDLGTGLAVASQLTVSTAGVNVQQLLPLYAKIPKGQFVKAGAYTDSITATISF